MRLVTVALIVLLAILQYQLWFGSGSIIGIFHLKHSIATQKKQNESLADRNAILRADVDDLRTGTAAIEERARNELGMVKQGETFYRVVNSNGPQTQTDERK